MSIEDKKLLNSFLNRTFFRDFKDYNSDRVKLFSHLELQLTSKCNLDCVYCYYNQGVGNGKELNPSKISKSDDLIKNTDILLSYLEDNEFYPIKIDLFGGEVLNQQHTFSIIEKLINYYSKKTFKTSPIISIPTNMSFLRSPKNTNRVIDIIKKAQSKNVIIGLSASVDGKHLDNFNRPIANAKNQSNFYNDSFYHKLFSFAKDVGCGFHPMIYHENIHKWIDNFQWYQEQFVKYDLPWYNIYLLEVRNDGWTKETCREFYKFYKYVLNFIYMKLNYNKDTFIKGFIYNGIDGVPNINKMNMFNNCGTIGRGLGCSLQTTMGLRLGDLTVNSCHRLSYDSLNGFKFIKDNDKIVDIEPMNFPFYLATISTEHKSWPYCESCLIKDICMSGCMGAQFETMNDAFTPIPSVCMLEHFKVKAQVDFLVDKKMFDDFLKYLSQDQMNAYINFYELECEEK